MLKDLRKYVVCCTIGKFGIFAGCLLVLIIGRSLGFYIVGIPVLIVSTIMVILCHILLLGKLKHYLNIWLLILQDIVFIATIVISIIFTPAIMVENSQWFSFKYEITTWHIIGFAILYVSMMAVPAVTDRKICKSILSGKGKNR